MPDAPPTFAATLIDWQRRAGRHDLPWQRTRDPYRIWVSEIMLQQTQVSVVRDYYARFVASYPDVAALADAAPDDVLRHWSGLGYYSRARNLLACAKAIVERHGGAFPTDPTALEALPGIGRSTAAAIAAFATGARVPILDGNVKRVLARVFAVDGFPGERAVEARLWAIAERELPAPGEGGMEIYTQALMDLGATVCVRTRPRCDACPVAARCEARLQGRVDALPAPRPARTVDTRDAHWLLLRAGDAVLLERRPARGIWGGLWSLPEIVPPARSRAAAGAARGTGDAATRGGGDGDGETIVSRLARWSAARLGADASRVGAPWPIAQVRHAFTHFRLSARVWAADIDIGEAVRPAAPDGLVWLALDDAADAPLPRPIKTLLVGLDPQPGALL